MVGLIRSFVWVGLSTWLMCVVLGSWVGGFAPGVGGWWVLPDL